MSDIITNIERVAVLEKVAHDYLMELQIALQDVKTQMAIGADRNSYLMLQIKEQELQVKVDALKYKLRSIDALQE